MQIAEGVINLKAEYGVDASGNGRIESTEWTAAAPADWSQVLAIRVAVLVRSRQFERNARSGRERRPGRHADGRQPVLLRRSGRPQRSAMTDVNGSDDSYDRHDADPNNWRYYRYRVYERVIPLRNVLWGTFG